MSKQDFSSSRFLPLLLLLGTALPAIAQKESPKMPPAAKEPQKLSDAEITVLREQRKNAVWLQKFIAAHPGQMDIGSSLALVPAPCDDFEKSNPGVSDAKVLCVDLREQYTIIQQDMKTGTDALPSGWQEKLEAIQKRIADYKAQHNEIAVHTVVSYGKPDPEFSQLVASTIGRIIDLSNGIVSQDDSVVLSDMNLIDEVQAPMAAALRARLLNYMVEESKAPNSKMEAVRDAVKQPVDNAATALIFSWLSQTISMQQGMKTGGGSFLLTATDWEKRIGDNLDQARMAAASAIRGENGRAVAQNSIPKVESVAGMFAL